MASAGESGAARSRVANSMPITKPTALLGRHALVIGAAVLFFAAVFALLLGMNMRRGLNHDEHQFVASAALIGRERLLPYTDFPYFHQPLLGFIYAWLYRRADWLLLNARLFSILCAWLGLWLVFLSAYRGRFSDRRMARFALAALAVLWLMATPPYTHTSGRAWNHDLPVLLTLLAFLLHSHILIRQKSPYWLLGSGLLMGLATVTRLSFVFTALPFLFAVWLYPAYTMRKRWLATGAFLGGCLLGAAPALPLFLSSPAAFLFGNVEYVRLNTQRFYGADAGLGTLVAGKLAYLGRMLVSQPGSLFVLLGLLIALWPLRTRLWTTPWLQSSNQSSAEVNSPVHRLRFLLLLLIFTLIGALAATPSQPQYFFALFPLIVLGLVDALAAHGPVHRLRRMPLLAALLLLTLALAIPAYLPGLAVVFSPGQWYPAKVHSRGQILAALVGAGKVLTLAPIHVLEGKARIYPEFVTGPFAWRVADLVDPARRAALHLVAPQELEDFLAADRPRGVLVGLEEDDRDEEAPLVDYARRHGYVPVDLPDEGTIWLSPQAAWNGAIVLGAQTGPAGPLQPGDSFLLALVLQNRQPLDSNLNVLVRLVGVDGAEIARAEGWPWGAPTSAWPVGEVRADGHKLTIPAAAAPGYYRIEVSFYDPATYDPFGETAIAGYVVVNGLDSRLTQGSALATFGEMIDLVAADVTTATLAAGANLPVRLVWQAVAPVARDYTAFAHLVDGAGQLVAQVDRPPLDGFLPTHLWQAGHPLIDELALPLPPDLQPGSYRLLVGLYDPATGERLVALTADGQRSDAVPIATLNAP